MYSFAKQLIPVSCRHSSTTVRNFKLGLALARGSRLDLSMAVRENQPMGGVKFPDTKLFSELAAARGPANAMYVSQFASNQHLLHATQ